MILGNAPDLARAIREGLLHNEAQIRSDRERGISVVTKKERS